MHAHTKKTQGDSLHDLKSPTSIFNRLVYESHHFIEVADVVPSTFSEAKPQMVPSLI